MGIEWTESDIPEAREQGRWQYVIEVGRFQHQRDAHEWRVIRFPAPGRPPGVDLGVPVAQGSAPSRADAIQQAEATRRQKMAEYREIDED